MLQRPKKSMNYSPCKFASTSPCASESTQLWCFFYSMGVDKFQKKFFSGPNFFGCVYKEGVSRQNFTFKRRQFVEVKVTSGRPSAYELTLEKISLLASELMNFFVFKLLFIFRVAERHDSRFIGHESATKKNPFFTPNEPQSQHDSQNRQLYYLPIVYLTLLPGEQ